MPLSSVRADDAADELHLLFRAQKKAYMADPAPGIEARLRKLDLLHNALVDYRHRLADAVNEDFENRSKAETEMAEILPLLEGIAYYRKRLRKLMKPQSRHVPMILAPAKVEVIYQPLGVVGIVVPWNFPIFLALSPLIGALAAGNRCLLKASEFAPVTGSLVKEMLASIFSADEVSMITGDVTVATEFTKLPFDHLVFTGSTSVGRVVMKAAAENLTPVTLELGGKSPVIIHEDFPMAEAARRIAFGKCLNAGQVCVSPDYVLCPKGKVEEFCQSFSRAVSRSYPRLVENPDYTGIISTKQKERLKGYLIDAAAKGAELREINPRKEKFELSRKMPMTIVIGATDDMDVMQNEIFGPILPVLPYEKIDEALDYVNSKPRPLALYYFDWDRKRAEEVLAQTHSGGACINDTMSQVLADDIPFGGVGPSGMGHYHGEEGFRTFSKAKGVVRKGRVNSTSFVAPPWGNMMFRGLMTMQAVKFRKRRVRKVSEAP